MNKYLEIYRELKKRINNKEYDEMLPSENVLTSEFAVSRNTIRRAVKLLEDEGYVVSKHGKGMFILDNHIDDFFLGGVESFAEVMQRTGKKFTTKVVELGVIVVDENLADKSGFAVGMSVTKIIRERLLEGQSVIVDVNYFSHKLVPELTREIATHSIYHYLESILQLEIKLSRRKIVFDYATDFDISHLQLGKYNMVATLQNQVFLSNGQQLEYTESHHRPDIFSFVDISTRG